MDFSQLPKMSRPPTADTPADPSTAPIAEPPVAAHYPQPVGYASYSPAEFGFASVWISLIAGVIFLALGQTFARWLLARVSGHAFETGVNWTDGPKSGQPVAYFELMGGTAWSDMGLFLMGVVLLLDALVIGLLATRRSPPRAIVVPLLALTGLALLLNVGVAFYLFSTGILPIVTLIAVLVGGFVMFDHLPLLRRSSER